MLFFARPTRVETEILRILEDGDLTGYEICRRLWEVDPYALMMGEGLLYPILQHMVHRKFIYGEWRINERGRKRRYYKLTKCGLEKIKTP